MKIAYIVPSLANTGPVNVVKDLSTLMVKAGHECFIYYFDNKKAQDFDCPVKRIAYKESMDFSEFDVVHSHGFRPDLFVMRNKKTSVNTRYVTTLHNYLFKDLRYQYNILTSLIGGCIWLYAIRKFDKIAVLSHDAKNYYSRFLKSSKIEVSYNTRIIAEHGLDSEEVNEIESFKNGYKLIGVNALLTKRKGIDLLIKALPQLPEYKLFIVGDGKELGNLKRISAKEKVEDRVYFAGYKQNAYRYLPYYDIYAIPSRSEGFPLSLLEAAIKGVKVVASDISIFKETFTEDEICFFKLNNISSLVESISLCDKKVQLSKNLYSRYMISYSPAIFLNRYITLYNE